MHSSLLKDDIIEKDEKNEKNNKKTQNIINDEEDNITFIFKHLGTYPCIIDYSRSFILLKLIEEDIIEKEKNNTRTNFIKNEQKRIISELGKIFPNYIKNNPHKMKAIFKNKNFNTLFIYFSAFDIFKFASNLLIFINKFSIQHNFKVNPEIPKLLDNIVKKAYTYLEKAIDEESYTNKKNITFPNLEMLLEFFPSFKMNNNKSIINKIKNNNIVDFFSINNIEENLDIYKMINEINENIKNNLKDESDIKSLNVIKEKIKNFINYNKLNEDLEIEQLINKEYYTVKNNLSFITTDNFTTGTISENDTIVYNY